MQCNLLESLETCHALRSPSPHDRICPPKTFHTLMSPLNAAAPSNTHMIRIRICPQKTFHALRSPLNAEALPNIRYMVMMPETFHALKSSRR